MLAVYKKPGEKAELIEVQNVLEDFQSLVQGNIEVMNISPYIYHTRKPSQRCLLICNETGKLDGLDANIVLGSDIVVGNIVVVAAGIDDFTSLTDDEAEKIKNELNDLDIF